MNNQELYALLVEDNAADVYLFKTALAETGIALRLAVARDGVEAWHTIESSADTFDLIILDLNLPGMTGREILRKMVLHPPARKIPIAVFTTSSTEGSIVEDFPEFRMLYMQKTHVFDELKRIVRSFADFASCVA